jgi:peptide/nickel transport system permease protein
VIVYIAERCAQLIPVLVGISLVVFLVMRVIPGDPAIAMLGENADPERLQQIRQSLGLDRPLSVQYLRYVGSAVTGDMGRSVLSNRPVTAELAIRFPATAELAFAGMTVALLVGVPLGIVAATRRGSLVDSTMIGISVIGVSMPVFFLGLLLVWLFGLVLGVLPISGRLSPEILLPIVTQSNLLDALLAGNTEALIDALRHLALPALTLGTIPMASIARMTRSGMLEVLGEDYVRTARAKGLSERRVMARHAIRNAAIPVTALTGLQIGTLLGGAVVTETIFAWPGIGRLLFEGVLNRDYPIVQGTVLVVTTIFALLNLAVDITYAALDPRIRLR